MRGLCPRVQIAQKSQIVVQAQKEAVNAGTSSGLFFSLSVLVLHCCGLIRACVLLGYEQSLSEGLPVRTERQLFHKTFAPADQRVRKFVLVLTSQVRKSLLLLY
jgi:hypothetical protein